MRCKGRYTNRLTSLASQTVEPVPQPSFESDIFVWFPQLEPSKASRVVSWVSLLLKRLVRSKQARAAFYTWTQACREAPHCNRGKGAGMQHGDSETLQYRMGIDIGLGGRLQLALFIHPSV